MMSSTINNTSQSMNFASSLHYVTNVTSFDRQFLHWSFIVLEVAAIVTTVVGDISMLMLFFTRKLLGQSTNILVFSVAIGDLLNGVLTFPLAMLQMIMQEPSEFMCKGYFYFANVSKTAVAYTILLLAMERIAAVLNCTYRILPPGRCLFFASLTWFFSAAYNIWSLVIYDMETVRIQIDVSGQTLVKGFAVCFASTRFMYLHEIFEFLNPLVTFAFPVISSCVLFLGFWLKKRQGDQPGRPYKSSTSIVIFSFALLVSFLATHIPWELANLAFVHDAKYHTLSELVVFKVLHIISFSRGFWDVFIFGAFRRYVCKKEKALAHFREQRSLQVQRSSLSIPIADRAASFSLLDSDPSVSRIYSSDFTTSRRPSANDGISSVCDREEHPMNELLNGKQQLSSGGHHSVEVPHRRKSTTITTKTISENYLIPRSPCLHEHSRRFSFAPHSFFPMSSNDFPNSVGKSRRNSSLLEVKTSPGSPSDSDKRSLNAPSALDNGSSVSNLENKPSLLALSPIHSPSITLEKIVGSKFTNSSTTATLHLTPRSALSPPSSLTPAAEEANSFHSFTVADRKKKKSCSFKDDVDIECDDSKLDANVNKKNSPEQTSKDNKEVLSNHGRSIVKVHKTNFAGKSGRKLSLFLETTFDLTASCPTTTAAVTMDNAENSAFTICEDDL